MKKSEVNRFHIYCNLALVLTALITGLSFCAQKLGMLYVEPFTFNTLRCLIGSVCLIPSIFLFKNVIPKPKNKKQYRKNTIKGGLIAGVVLFIALSLNQYCMIVAPAGKAGFITALYIIFVPIIATFLKQKLSSRVKLSIFIATMGLYLLCGQTNFEFNIWDFFLLMSAFYFGLHIMVLNHYAKKANVIKLSCIQFLTTGLLSLPLMLLLETPSLHAILSAWKPILFIGVIVTGIGYTLQTFGLKATKPVIAALILSFESVFALMGGMLLLNETLSTKEALGCVIMFLAILLSQLPRKHKSKKTHSPVLCKEM